MKQLQDEFYYSLELSLTGHIKWTVRVYKKYNDYNNKELKELIGTDYCITRPGSMYAAKKIVRQYKRRLKLKQYEV